MRPGLVRRVWLPRRLPWRRPGARARAATQGRRVSIRFASAPRIDAGGQPPWKRRIMRRGDRNPRPCGRVYPALKRLGAGFVPASPRDLVRLRNRVFDGADGLGLRSSTLHQVDANCSKRGEQRGPPNDPEIRRDHPFGHDGYGKSSGYGAFDQRPARGAEHFSVRDSLTL